MKQRHIDQIMTVQPLGWKIKLEVQIFKWQRTLEETSSENSISENSVMHSNITIVSSKTIPAMSKMVGYIFLSSFMYIDKVRQLHCYIKKMFLGFVIANFKQFRGRPNDSAILQHSWQFDRWQSANFS